MAEPGRSQRFRTLYGAGPVHLVAAIACFALAGYVLLHVAGDPALPRIAIWFAAAIVAHDLVLFPLYALGDRLLNATRRTRRVPLVNHVRIPVLASGLLLLMFLPGIIRQGARQYLTATGQTQQPFLGRWLAITGVLFAASALLYAVRWRRAGAPHRALARGLRGRLPDGERTLAVGYDAADLPTVLVSTGALYATDPARTTPTANPALDKQGVNPAPSQPAADPARNGPGVNPARTGPGADPARWGWEDVADVAWQPASGTLDVEVLPGAGSSVELPVVDGERLAEAARERVAATRVAHRRVALTDAAGGWVTVRRRPNGDDLVWRVRLDPSLDPADPGVRSRLDAALLRLAADLGLPSGPPDRP